MIQWSKKTYSDNAISIDVIISLTGGYPSLWARFPNGPSLLYAGDYLNVRYNIEVPPTGRVVVLKEAFKVVKKCVALGVAVQGIVIEDLNDLYGHAIADQSLLKPMGRVL